jgi:pilus assembly protein Flp/PilA
MVLIRRLLREDSGATAIEYALIASLIAIVIVGSLTGVGANLAATFGRVSNGFP